MSQDVDLSLVAWIGADKCYTTCASEDICDGSRSSAGSGSGDGSKLGTKVDTVNGSHLSAGLGSGDRYRTGTGRSPNNCTYTGADIRTRGNHRIGLGVGIDDKLYLGSGVDIDKCPSIGLCEGNCPCLDIGACVGSGHNHSLVADICTRDCSQIGSSLGSDDGFRPPLCTGSIENNVCIYMYYIYIYTLRYIPTTPKWFSILPLGDTAKIIEVVKYDLKSSQTSSQTPGSPILNTK